MVQRASLTILPTEVLNQDVILKETPAIADGVFYSKELKSDIIPPPESLSPNPTFHIWPCKMVFWTASQLDASVIPGVLGQSA